MDDLLIRYIQDFEDNYLKLIVPSLITLTFLVTYHFLILPRREKNVRNKQFLSDLTTELIHDVEALQEMVRDKVYPTPSTRSKFHYIYSKRDINETDSPSQKATDYNKEFSRLAKRVKYKVSDLIYTYDKLLYKQNNAQKFYFFWEKQFYSIRRLFGSKVYLNAHKNSTLMQKLFDEEMEYNNLLMDDEAKYKNPDKDYYSDFAEPASRRFKRMLLDILIELKV